MPPRPTCLCGECSTCYKREYARNRYRAKAYGTWDPKRDITAARAHIEELRSQYVGLRRIADESGYQYRQLLRIVSGERKWISPENEARILAVRPDAAWRVATYRAARRLQALNAIGYTTRRIAAECSITQEAVWDILSQGRKWISRPVFERITATYERLHMKPAGNALSIASARRNGYAAPMSWDDIDDPDEVPQPTPGDFFGHADPVVVDRILSGQNMPANKAEKVAVVAEWRALGRPVNELARLTGWKVERYYEEKIA